MKRASVFLIAISALCLLALSMFSPFEGDNIALTSTNPSVENVILPSVSGIKGATRQPQNERDNAVGEYFYSQDIQAEQEDIDNLIANRSHLISDEQHELYIRGLIRDKLEFFDSISIDEPTKLNTIVAIIDNAIGSRATFESFLGKRISQAEFRNRMANYTSTDAMQRNLNPEQYSSYLIFQMARNPTTSAVIDKLEDEMAEIIKSYQR